LRAFVHLYLFASFLSSSFQVISRLSGAAALFTLVFGGWMCVLSWCLVLVRSVRTCTILCWLSGVGFLLVYVSIVSRVEAHAMSVIVPHLILGALWSMARIRRLQIEQQKRGFVDDSVGRWVAALVRRWGCCCCVSACCVRDDNEDEAFDVGGGSSIGMGNGRALRVALV
jgi:hypothetical protein